MPEKSLRTIRSFVRREGRLTKGQQRALQELWPRYGIATDTTPLDLTRLFGREAPRVLEIGFGDGRALAQTAALHPEQDFLGIEVHRPGIGALLLLMEQHQLHNIRLLGDDAVEVLKQRIPNASLDRVQIFFPDPWHKKRHHKRRIIQPEFVNLLGQKLKSGGLLHLATDWEDYAGHMLKVMSQALVFHNLAGPGQFAPRPATRPLTKFEQRGQRLGHGVWDMLFEKI